MSKKFKIITLGCKVNQAESLGFERDFLSAGVGPTGEGETADYVIVNTCCVTSIAERKSRKAIRGALKKFPKAVVLATGCSVNLDKSLSQKIPGISEIFSNEEKPALSGKIASLNTGSKCQLKQFSTSPRVPLKVADGCNERCAYCVVPLVRGQVKSRPAEEILTEARLLAAEGKKELILTAINLGLYGADFEEGRHHLQKLIDKLSEISGLWRIRLSSLEPMYFSGELIDFFMKNPKICHHFYIPLQSGSGKILRLMGRRYTPDDFLKIIEKFQHHDPEVSVNTDVIVGFPGEEGGDFQTSYEFIKNAGFSRLHVFPYSSRPGTGAAGLAHQLASREIKERVNRMLKLRREIMMSFHQKFLGRTVEILAEEFHPETGQLEGLTGNYLRVFSFGSSELIGQIVPVKITAAKEEFLEGAVVD
jgi:threonylcarbamoyladenosine tRNA methylthiotransferase MtaB